MASGVGAVFSVALLLLRRRRHLCRRRRRCDGTVESLHCRHGRWVCRDRLRERRCPRSVRHDGVVVGDYAADRPPNKAAMAVRPDSGGGVGGGKNGVGGGSNIYRDNDDHDADAEQKKEKRPGIPPKWRHTQFLEELVYDFMYLDK